MMLLREKGKKGAYDREGECDRQPSSQQQRQDSQSEPVLSRVGGQHSGAAVLILPRRLLINYP